MSGLRSSRYRVVASQVSFASRTSGKASGNVSPLMVFCSAACSSHRLSHAAVRFYGYNNRAQRFSGLARKVSGGDRAERKIPRHSHDLKVLERTMWSTFPEVRENDDAGHGSISTPYR